MPRTPGSEHRFGARHCVAHRPRQWGSRDPNSLIPLALLRTKVVGAASSSATVGATAEWNFHSLKCCAGSMRARNHRQHLALIELPCRRDLGMPRAGTSDASGPFSVSHRPVTIHIHGVGACHGWMLLIRSQSPLQYCALVAIVAVSNTVYEPQFTLHSSQLSCGLLRTLKSTVVIHADGDDVMFMCLVHANQGIYKTHPLQCFHLRRTCNAARCKGAEPGAHGTQEIGGVSPCTNLRLELHAIPVHECNASLPLLPSLSSHRGPFVTASSSRHGFALTERPALSA